jgi:hypothetical protein
MSQLDVFTWWLRGELDVNAQERKKLQAAFEVMEVLCEEVGETLPMRQGLALMSVALRSAQNGEADLKDVAKDIAASSAVTSRDLLVLGKRGRNGRAGLNLVAAREDYTDLRRRPYLLTLNGNRVVEKILNVL